MPARAGLLEPRGVGTWTAKIYLMPKILYASCLGLSPAISSQFSVEMRAASKNCEKFTKTPFLGGFKVAQGQQC